MEDSTHTPNAHWTIWAWNKSESSPDDLTQDFLLLTRSSTRENASVLWPNSSLRGENLDIWELSPEGGLDNQSFALGSNLTGNETEYLPYNLRPETYLVPVLFAIIFLTGVIGNGALIFMFLKHPKLWSAPNIHLVSLAAGDLLMVLLTVPFTSMVYTVPSYPFGESVCRASEFAKDLSLGITVFTLTALSADRYLAIVRPVSTHVSEHARKIAIGLAIGIWVLSAILAAPAAVFSQVPVLFTPRGDEFYICTPFPKHLGELYPKIHTLVRVTLYYLLPLSLIGFFYVMMAHHLLVSARHLPGEGAGAAGQQRQVQARRKVAKMVLAFVIIFAICFLPINIYILWWHFCPSSQDDYNVYWHSFRIVGFCLSFINSCINPIALYCVSGTFRKYYNRHVFCWCVSRRKLQRDFDGTECTQASRCTQRTVEMPLSVIGAKNGAQPAAPHRLTLTNTAVLTSKPYHNPSSIV
ncbi:neuropeptide CCHamide-1 receptor-like [Macrobrachium nipponense]|uniref:neuropeptide CCHamide-1 receptor-like n=1 Tax=Macrobrachium nipponense TaxID=159736 RepID=UPI0030C8C060